MGNSMKTEKLFQLLIFDWDGTMADSLHHIVRAVRFAADKMELPEKNDTEIKNIIGLGLGEAMERLFPGIDNQQIDSVVEHYRSYYFSTTNDGIDLFPGVKETIRLLHANGFDLAVATGKSRRGLDRALEDSGLSEYFHFTRCADETFSKPHPQMLEDIIDTFDLNKDKVLMIGDSEHDLQMAINAGVSSAAVTYGAQNIEYLLKFRPATCFNNLRELPPWLDKKSA